MRRSEPRPDSEARWLNDLRHGYTDVLPVVRDRHSFDARWADGHWTRDPAWQPQTQEPPPPPPSAPAPAPLPLPARDRTATDGRVFFVIMFWSALATSLELWWLETVPGSLSDTGAVFLAVGRVTGMVGGFVLLAQILLMSRVGWLERWLGAHALLTWHRELGGYLLVMVLAHMAATIVGYALGSEMPILHETWTMISADGDMVTATLGTALLVVVGLMSIRALRRLMSYEKWYYLHLTSYLVVVLAYGHQFTAGRELSGPGFGRFYWIGLHLFVVACLVWGRIVEPLALNLRHRLRVAEVGDGSVVGRPAVRSAAVELAAEGTSTTAEVDGGREVLVAVAGLPGGTAVIRAFVSDEELDRGVGRAWFILGLLGLSLLAVSVLVADRLSRTVTRPLTAVAHVSDLLARGDLRARAVPGGPPEVRRVGRGLNHLAGQIGVLLAREREAAADLSHRLRTPLTALRVDAETLSDPQEQARIVADVDALQRTVDDIIRIARNIDIPPQRRTCDAAVEVLERARFWSALADEEDRRIEVRVEEAVVAAVTAEDLAACVDALLGNVFAHTPEGVPCLVELRRRPEGGACLMVADRGPGMASALRQRGASRNGSTGLGLDIVGRTATASGGGMSITPTTGGGTTVTVLLR